MREQRSIGREHAYSRHEEQMGMRNVNHDRINDDMASGHNRRFDAYQMRELEPSASMQLDTMGMQPHAREYLERKMTCKQSDRKFEMVAGQMMDYVDGIQFTDMP